MRESLLGLLVLAAILRVSSPSLAVSSDWAIVGNPGNAPDTEVMNDGTTGYGSVNYTYRISKHEVTNSSYTEFLNAVAATDTNSLYNQSMGTQTLGGIVQSGSPGTYSYAVKEDSIGNGPGGTDYTYGDKPVTYVSFLDAMRFSNWLENGQPSGGQNASTTEDGVYAISDGVSEIRDPNATYFISGEDEWYKAAYYDPNIADYYDYATSTDSVPNNNLPSADTGNSANFWDTHFTTSSFSHPMTDVGAYTNSESPYGTYDQSGNVFEWNESRVYRGGSYGPSMRPPLLEASERTSIGPSHESANVGFRIAAIPEPTTSALALAALCLAMSRRRAF